MSLLRELLTYAVKNEASDVHLKTARPPAFRLHGTLKSVGDRALTREETEKIVEDLLPPHLKDSYYQDHEIDLSHHEPDVGRFRVNIFHSSGAPTVAMRHVKTVIPTFDDLSLPGSLRELALSTQRHHPGLRHHRQRQVHYPRRADPTH
jgi:twitching motility protein PilT